MKRLARIPTVFALVAMVAACADMTAPELSDEPLLRVIPIISVTCVVDGENLVGSVLLPAERASLPGFRVNCKAAGGHLFPGILDVS